MENLLVGNLNVQHAVELNTGLLQGLGLGDGAGHPVQDVALLAVRLGQALGDDADDHLVRDQLARVHVASGLESHGRAVFHGSPQDVACGNGGHVQPLAKDGGLGPLTGAGGAEHDELHSLTSTLTQGSPCSGAS